MPNKNLLQAILIALFILIGMVGFMMNKDVNNCCCQQTTFKQCTSTYEYKPTGYYTPLVEPGGLTLFAIGIITILGVRQFKR